jgi:hypothetical protein
MVVYTVCASLSNRWNRSPFGVCLLRLSDENRVADVAAGMAGVAAMLLLVPEARIPSMLA